MLVFPRIGGSVLSQARNAKARDADSVALFARFLRTVGAQEGLRPVARDGVAALVDGSTRAAEDTQKLSLRTSEMLDIVREADPLAARGGAATVTAAHVADAIAARQRRLGRVRVRVIEMIRRDTILIATTGSVVGQVNGLTVADIGELRFGMPIFSRHASPFYCGDFIPRNPSPEA